MSIDLVNLRSETYSDNSRVPEISIGTPLEDAQRRDLTINSLFYNLNESKVEDHLETGVKDLRAGLIKTPLEPFQTFTDDPLRVLRTI
jgi:tRNA nucleotidyltransferase (CCA-adding enzyme)